VKKKKKSGMITGTLLAVIINLDGVAFSSQQIDKTIAEKRKIKNLIFYV